MNPFSQKDSLQETVQEVLLQEGISSFRYQVPKDKSESLFDFYILTSLPLWGLQGNQQLRQPQHRDSEALITAAEEAQEKIVEYLQRQHLQDLLFSISAEFRHVLAENSAEKLADFAKKNGVLNEFQKYVMNYKMRGNNLKELIPRLEKIRTEYDENDSRGYLDSYKSILSSFKDISKFVDFAKKAFVQLIWARNYGGEPWANICEGWIKLNMAKSYNDKVVWIDHVFDLQHNTNTVFNKIKAYSKLGSYEWIKEALDKKKEARSLFDIVDDASPSVKTFAARVIKAATGETYHSWMKGRSVSADDDKSEKVPKLSRIDLDLFVWGGDDWSGDWSGGLWKDGTFKKGTWKNGTWQFGIWENGTWKDGVWQNGVWQNGTWEKGIWENGTWQNGTWAGGSWKNGTWENGTWEGGLWKDGTWEGGLWKDGIWQKGTWVKGTWKNGIWRDGTWGGGTWVKGTWKNGTWEVGIWEGGLWKDGTWEGGLWKGGLWRGGVWKGGYIFDPELNKKVESKISPKDYFLNKLPD